MLSKEQITTIYNRLCKAVQPFPLPLIDQLMLEFDMTPFMILIACLLSLRVKDLVTIHVCRDLFKQVTTPKQFLAIPREKLERMLFKTGFYRNKARVVHEVSDVILNRFGGVVPDTLEELMSIKGVGLKTAHLVVGMAFGKPAICVDTHVHRISNRLGVIRTRNPEESEAALRRVLPQEFWIKWNTFLVIWGQNVCVPISPKCSQCPLSDICKRVGVTRSR